MRIAIASSGLGHVCRGIETWARDLAEALRRVGQDVTLFQGGGQPADPWCIRLWCLQRFDARTDKLVSVFRHLGGWRYGMGSIYSIEQTTFAVSLWRKVRAEFDILHVQDPLVALVLDLLHRGGLSRPKVILGHGTEEDVSFLQKLSNIQHLAPIYDNDWQKHRLRSQFSVGIPNFVDTNRFCPGDKRASRYEWDLPQDAFVVLSVAALKKTHKRCDYVISEFKEFRKSCSKAVLVLAGGRDCETDEIMTLAGSIGKQSVRVYESLARDRLISLYQAADIFVIGSLWEMMPIAVIEALSCGLPVICHDASPLKWVVGDGGWSMDIKSAGAMAHGLQLSWNSDLRSIVGVAARRRALSTFSHRRIVEQIVMMYQSVVDRVPARS